MMKRKDFKKQFAHTMTKGDYRKLSMNELILLDNFWKKSDGVRLTVDLRTVMFGKMFTVEQFRKKTLIVVPVPKKYFMHHDPAYRWVWFEGKTHLAPLRYLKILSKKKNHELR